MDSLTTEYKHEGFEDYNPLKTEYDHERVPTAIENMKCSFCEKEFRYKATFKNHLWKVHNMKFEIKKENSDDQYMQAPIVSEKQFHCQHCEKTFLHKKSLRIHERTHTGENPYSCNNCDEKFMELKKLQRHQKFHCQKCPICNEMFQSKLLKMDHIVSVHPEKKIYSCKYCNFRSLNLKVENLK